MKIKFHNVGFGPGGKPIFHKTVTIPRRKLRVESVKSVNSPKKFNKNEETEKTRASSPKPTKWRFRSPSHRKRNCQNGRSPYKFYPAQQGLRSWIGQLSFLLVPNMVLEKMNIHEHRTRQTFESYTFQPHMGFWPEIRAVDNQTDLRILL